MTFSRMMYGVACWHNGHVTAKSELPLKLTFEVGSVDLAAEILHKLHKEISPTVLQPLDLPPIELGRPFQFMGIMVEFKLRQDFLAGEQVDRIGEQGRTA